ncbi:hypothetical protein [Pararhodobacter sp.]|uniref:hypothetical protein n=1 Tax=Pararhodobacter sp. TaxID=2127056 RepID=UPI002AFFB5F9|nr:hypothetical protein [Pararhodobacter sp.]
MARESTTRATTRRIGSAGPAGDRTLGLAFTIDGDLDRSSGGICVVQQITPQGPDLMLTPDDEADGSRQDGEASLTRLGAGRIGQNDMTFAPCRQFQGSECQSF